MLIAISGSQGSGKSTILSELEKLGAKTVTRKTSRSILTDWGVTLKQVNDDHDLTIRFQEEITRRKLADEVPAYLDSGLWFTERTHADLFTYALISLGKDNSYSKWLNSYYNTCMLNNQTYSHVFYLRAGLFSVSHDGTRGSNLHYSRMVDLTMFDVTTSMSQPARITTIDTPDLEQRVNLIGAHTRLIKG